MLGTAADGVALPPTALGAAADGAALLPSRQRLPTQDRSTSALPCG